MPKVSVIVPMYNASKYLSRCLDSLTNQTLKDIEIVLINDGSTDNSEQIIQTYLKDKRIKYLKKENGGQGSARNLGLTVAKGEYISFVDSDDYIELDMLEEMYNASLSKYDIVVSDFYITSNGNDTYSTILKRDGGIINNSEYLFTGACPWNKIYKKTFLDKISFKFPEGIIYEDFAVIPTLVLYNPSMYYVKKAYVHYVQSEDSTMRVSEYKSKHEDIFVAVNYLYNSFKNSSYQEELTYIFAYHFLLLGSLYFYRFEKYDNINKISDFMHKNFPKWANNKYVKELCLKDKALMKLFYNRRYKTIKFVQKLKG